VTYTDKRLESDINRAAGFSNDEQLLGSACHEETRRRLALKKYPLVFPMMLMPATEAKYGFKCPTPSCQFSHEAVLRWWRAGK